MPGHLGDRSVDGLLGVLPSDPEVREQGTAIGREDDVGGLHVAMDDAGRMRRHERCRDVADNSDRFADRKLPVLREVVSERRPGHVVENDRSLVVGQVAVANADDIRAFERLERPRLAFEPPAGGRIGEDDRMQPLDRDFVAGLLVDGAPYLGAPAGSGAFEQPVAPEQDSLFHAVQGGGRGAPAALRPQDAVIALA